ncbi:MAG: CBS domain-containing protein [Planctomycetota bacterium]|jgi:CBS domain-containing protein
MNMSGDQGLFSRRVHSIDSAESLSSAARLMAREHIGSLVVMEEGSAVGLVTDRDIALHGLLSDNVAEQCVKACTSRPLITIHEDADLSTMARTLNQHGVRRALVVDGDGRPVGMLSADDLLSFLGREVGQLATAIQREFQAESDTRLGSCSIFGSE